MILPELAPVRPRVTSPDLGESVLLEDVVSRLIDEQGLSTVYLVGNSGDGKSTALAHLAAVFETEEVLLVDDEQEPVSAEVESRLTAVACRKAPDSAQHVLHLTGWGDDDVIECVLRLYPLRSKSIMSRVLNCPERERIEGSPALWRVILEQFAANDEITNCRAALLSAWHLATKADERSWVARECFSFLSASQNASEVADYELAFLTKIVERTANNKIVKLLAHRFVRNLVTAQMLASALQDRGLLQAQWPSDLVDDVVSFVVDRSQAKRDLREHVTAPIINRGARKRAKTRPETFPSSRAMATSLLARLSDEHLPRECKFMLFQGAYLEGAKWQQAQLQHASLERADMRGADLAGSTLDHAKLDFANLDDACLRNANLSHVSPLRASFCEADLSGATAKRCDFRFTDFQSANFSNGNFCETVFNRANLCGAKLRNAQMVNVRLWLVQLDEADFSGADLSYAHMVELDLRTAILHGAKLKQARMQRVDLEFVEINESQMTGADLRGALLTGSRFTNVVLHGANLSEAALAEIEWEGADLRWANFENCTFHLGSSRSGLVDSPYPCEGSRTGFYTDDFGDQHFKSAEEIRKANLCGADLRGANVDNTDFYLVDLRGAVYDRAQAAHFERCKAILHDPE